MTYSFHPEARRELEQAIEYYEGCADRLGFDFYLLAIMHLRRRPGYWRDRVE